MFFLLTYIYELVQHKECQNWGGRHFHTKHDLYTRTTITDAFCWDSILKRYSLSANRFYYEHHMGLMRWTHDKLLYGCRGGGHMTDHCMGVGEVDT